MKLQINLKDIMQALKSNQIKRIFFIEKGEVENVVNIEKTKIKELKDAFEGVTSSYKKKTKHLIMMLRLSMFFLKKNKNKREMCLATLKEILPEINHWNLMRQRQKGRR